MGCYEYLLVGSLGQLLESIDQLFLQLRMEVGIRFVEQQYVHIRARGQSEDAEPLQKAASLHHEVTFRESVKAVNWRPLSVPLPTRTEI